jgi:signal transduction histidine kinase
VQAYRLRWQQRLLKVEELRALAGERTRIARDLHDDLGGTLTGIALQLEAARQRGHAGPDELALLAGEARALTHDLRELAWATNPRCDNTGSLRSFLGEVAERFCAAAGLACRLDLPPVEMSSSVPARVRHEILVVLKESLANISRHAAARNVTIQLQLAGESVQLVIQDDGRGFDPGLKSNGAGLRNLRERVQQAGGQFTVESRPQHGTTTTASFPVANHENTGP